MMRFIPDAIWLRWFPEDISYEQRERQAAADERAMANARRIEALNVPEPFFIDRSTGRYYPNPARVVYDEAHPV